MFILESKALLSPSLCSPPLVSTPLTQLSSSSCFRPQKSGRVSHSRLAIVCDLEGQATGGFFVFLSSSRCRVTSPPVSLPPELGFRVGVAVGCLIYGSGQILSSFFL